MGLFGGSTSRSGSAQKWAKPFAKAAASSVQDVFNQNQPQLQQITQGVTSTLPQLSSQYQAWQPNTTAAQGYYGDVLSGKYLDPSTNPGLQSLLDRNTMDTTNQVNSQFSMAGRYGSGAHTGVLTRELADSNGAILADQYNRERAAMDTAASTVPQLQGSVLSQLLQGSQVGAELPYTGTNNLASSLSALFSGGTQKTSNGIGGVLQGIGSIASGAAMFSDRRLKTNIRKLGEFADGLGKYAWTYIWGGPEYTGVMADEVDALRPWALGGKVMGFDTVRYDLLGEC